MKALSLVVPLLLLGVHQPPVSARDDGSGCRVIKATLTSTADLANFTTEGTIRGNLHGTTRFIGDPASLNPVPGPALPPLNPTFSYTGDLIITTRHGTLTTRSVGVFEFSPSGLGTQFDRVIAGTGRFRGATGELFANFRATSTLSGFVSAVTGRLCLAGAGDEDDEGDE